jgi:hypothetical protein
MADKYLQSYVPASEQKYRSVKTRWGGLNRLQTTDTGQLTDCKNISVSELPALVPAPVPALFEAFPGREALEENGNPVVPISLHAFGDDLVEIYRVDNKVYIDYFNADDASVKTAVLKEEADESDDSPRCLVQFNVFTTPDPIADIGFSEFVKKILIFPDKKSFDYKPDDFILEDLEVKTDPEEPVLTGFPNIKYATVFQSRLFGVDDGKVYASGFNDYTNWIVDSPDNISPSNAWATTAQANVKADGNFTGITAYGGYVVCFKSDFMHQIHNTKNPFRVVDIGAYGAVSNQAYAEVNGRLIFVSPDNVFMYGGGNPVPIGNVLNISDFSGAVCGGIGNTFYMCLDNKVYIYNTDNGQWGSTDNDCPILNFAATDNSLFAYFADGSIRKMNSGSYGDWNFVTDILAFGNLNIKRIKRISLLADVSEGASVTLGYIDDSGVYHAITSNNKTGMHVIRAGVRMSSGEFHKIKVCGNGFARIHYLGLDVAYGGDLYG